MDGPMARNPLHDVCIVGAYNTPQAKILPDWPEPALLIDAMVDGKPSFMTVAWCSIANADPPMFSVAIHRSRYTRRGIDQGGVVL